MVDAPSHGRRRAVARRVDLDRRGVGQRPPACNHRGRRLAARDPAYGSPSLPGAAGAGADHSSRATHRLGRRRPPPPHTGAARSEAGGHPSSSPATGSCRRTRASAARVSHSTDPHQLRPGAQRPTTVRRCHQFSRSDSRNLDRLPRDTRGRARRRRAAVRGFRPVRERDDRVEHCLDSEAVVAHTSRIRHRLHTLPCALSWASARRHHTGVRPRIDPHRSRHGDGETV